MSDYSQVLSATHDAMGRWLTAYNDDKWADGREIAREIAEMYSDPEGRDLSSADKLTYLLIEVAGKMYHGGIFHRLEQRLAKAREVL